MNSYFIRFSLLLAFLFWHQISQGQKRTLKLAATTNTTGISSLPTKPNIIHIVADDVGWDDFSCMGASDIKTPNIDSIAKQGLKLTRFYAPASSCTPTRVALLTGRHAARANNNKGLPILWPQNTEGLDPNLEIALPRLLKPVGYSSAMIGKWHLGSQTTYNPIRHGFDYFTGILCPNDHGPERHGNTNSEGLGPIPLLQNLDTIRFLDNNTLAELPAEFTRNACQFIRQQVKAGRPFYMQYSNIETHTPWFIPKGFEGANPKRRFQESVEYFDRSVGAIIRTLRELKAEENTLVVITSDNGPLVHPYPELEQCYGWYATVDTSRKHQLFEGKYQSKYEGGMRVPCIISWPKTVPANTESNQITAGFDLFSTFVKIAGATIPQDRPIDGKDISQLMFQPNNPSFLKKPIRTLFAGISARGKVESISYKNYKLVLKGEKNYALYDLDQDLMEQLPLNSTQPKTLEILKRELQKVQENIRLGKAINCSPSLEL